MPPGYHYRITVDVLEVPKDDVPHGDAPPDGPQQPGATQPGAEGEARSLSFFALDRDDILAIVDTVRAHHNYNASTAASLAVGLKLFTAVMLEHRNDPLFKPLREPMREFIHLLKSPAEPLQQA